MLNAEKREKLEKYIERVPFSGCWIYMGSDVTNMGYGRVFIDGRRHSAHRFAYELYVGAIGDQCVLHRCDVPLCINPDHLWLGTQRQNMEDKARKGRAADRHGEKHPLHRLTKQEIEVIRDLYRVGAKQQTLAEQFGIGQSHVSRVVNMQARAKG